MSTHNAKGPYRAGIKNTLSVLLTLIISALFIVNTVHAKTSASEQELRAAVIVSVLRFTTWPEDPSQQVHICLAGKPISSKYLLRLDGQKKIKRSSLFVRRVSKPAEITGCDALVIGNDITSKTLDKMMTHATNSPTVSLCDGCEREELTNATIYLNLHEHRIQFEVYWEHIKKRGVLFDPSLLELASNRRRQ